MQGPSLESQYETPQEKHHQNVTAFVEDLMFSLRPRDPPEVPEVSADQNPWTRKNMARSGAEPNPSHSLTHSHVFCFMKKQQIVLSFVLMFVLSCFYLLGQHVLDSSAHHASWGPSSGV